ncbi:MAG: hypothetical protein KF764_27115 [Labilithrix sp.]|nr:hypothetical protein [Labilithrix sp.]MBX3223559.1 hypothetical protein [Labilithrix sp.]
MNRRAPPSIAGLALVALGVLTGEEARGEPASSVPEPEVHHAPLPDTSLGFQPAAPRPTLAWAALQLVPSPEVAVGRQRHVGPSGEVDAGPRAAFGLRWQLTPVLWSFGVHPSQPRWRTFVVDPLARQSGSIELSTSFEYIGGHVDRLLARPGLRVYLPVAHKGEYLSVSLGTSVYAYEGFRVAYDVGAYILAGTLGVQMTVAPAHAPLAAIATVRLRYF